MPGCRPVFRRLPSFFYMRPQRLPSLSLSFLSLSPFPHPHSPLPISLPPILPFPPPLCQAAYDYGKTLLPRKGTFEPLFYALGLNEDAPEYFTPVEDASHIGAEVPPLFLA